MSLSPSSIRARDVFYLARPTRSIRSSQPPAVKLYLGRCPRLSTVTPHGSAGHVAIPNRSIRAREPQRTIVANMTASTVAKHKS